MVAAAAGLVAEMNLNTHTPRYNETKRVKDQGLVYCDTVLPDGSVRSYWAPDRHYVLTEEDDRALRTASAEIFEMCIEAGDYLLAHPELMKRMGIPEWAFKQIARTWGIEDPAYGSVYARFDLCFGGVDHPNPAYRTPRLYEFNADTPTGLVESAHIQWHWREEAKVGGGQWNDVYERLIAAWKRNLALIEDAIGRKPVVYFAFCTSEKSGEDLMNTQYLKEGCAEAGYQTVMIPMSNIVLGDDGRFYDGLGNHIDVIFKLYPWEFMVTEEFGQAVFGDMTRTDRSGTIWIEPPYKMLWSNKGLLAVLWRLFGQTDKAKYLIPAWFAGDEPRELLDYVKKPLLGREGASIEVFEQGEQTLAMDGDYGSEGYIIQKLAPPPAFLIGQTTHFPVVGVWMIDGEPAGYGIRDNSSIVTDNLSQFVPWVLPTGALATY